MEAVVQVKELRKVYGKTVAVDGISFDVQQGEIFGLLGPNGAGKTSTLECLAGLRGADGGWLRVMGVDPAREASRLKNTIGVQLQTSGLPDSMRVDEAMRFFCAYHGVAPRYELLGRMGLESKRKAQYVALSTGQKRRLALALAVAHQPPVVLLDEPTAGLDVQSRSELHTMMKELQRSGATILLATHDMAEAEKMADRVAILLRGRVAALGTPRQLTAAGGGLTKVSARTEGGSLTKDDISLPSVTRSLFNEDYAVYFSADPGPTVTAILNHIAAQGDRLIDLRVERPSLEERFLEITNETPKGGGA